MCTCLKYSLFWAPVQCLLVPDWTAFCPGCSKQSWLNTFRLAAFGVPPCVAQDAGQIWLQHVWSSLDTMWWATAEFPKHCCHLWQARYFYLFIHGLFTQQISLRTRIITGTEQNTKANKNLQVRGVLSEEESWHLSGPSPPHIPPEETEAQRNEVLHYQWPVC